MKRHRLHTRVFEAWNPNQKCFRIERRAWRKAKVISTPVLLPPPLPPRLFIFHKSLSKRAQYFGIIGNGSVGQEERGEGKKTKKIIIKMSHRESPMSRESERKKKKKFGNIIKIRWKPPPPRRPPSPPPPTRFPYPLFEFRGIPLGYLGRTARTQTSIRSYSTRVERICHLVPSGFRLVK